MKKIAISVLGYDRPGIIASVARLFFENQCNIQDVSQTILQTEFAGVFIVSIPDDVDETALLERLWDKLNPLGLSVLLKSMEGEGARDWEPPPSEPFVLTTSGPDRLGLVAGIAELLAGFRINIGGLRAVFRGGDNPHDNIMIYEIDVPASTDQNTFRAALRERALELGLEASLQHREIFEEIHRI